MTLEFSGEAISWRGPAPFVFVPVPANLSAEIREIAPLVSYGWGAIPATLQVGNTKLKTSLFPKDGVYFVPIRVLIQRQEGVTVGDKVQVRLEIQPRI